jgi:hypothetical protein
MNNQNGIVFIHAGCCQRMNGKKNMNDLPSSRNRTTGRKDAEG